MRRWMISASLLALFGVLAVGSKVTKREPDDDDARPSASAGASAAARNIPARLREDVVAAIKPFGRAEYAPRDPAILDPCIEDAIAHTETGSEKYDERVASAAACVMRKLRGDAQGREVLTKLLAARYAAPVITRTGDTVRVDLGQVAGEVKDYGSLRVATELWDADGLVPSEVVKHLKLGMEKEPGAERYQIEVQNEVPRSRTAVTAKHTYVYRRSKKRIEVYADGTDYCFTAPLPDDLSGVSSLNRRDLTCEARPLVAGERYDPRTHLDR